MHVDVINALVSMRTMTCIIIIIIFVVYMYIIAIATDKVGKRYNVF